MKQLGVAARTRLHRLEGPVLLLLAALDETVDNTRTRAAFDALPRAEVTTRVLEAHHGVQFECPRELSQEMLGWLRLKSGDG